MVHALKVSTFLGISKLLKRFVFHFEHPSIERKVFGLHFKNPVGLAAGFDKDAELINAMEDLGFGFVEIGTLTPRPQPGNPRPRLFRLIKDKALINRMGFNNRGVGDAIPRLKDRYTKLIVGGNIGKNKDTPNDKAKDDYVYCLHALYDHVDYFVINISSPNTPGLRNLQSKKPLTELLKILQQEIGKKAIKKPLLLKIAPDLTDHQLDDIIEILNSLRLDGVVATNTTISRSGLKTNSKDIRSIGDGGLSGLPLAERSNEVIKYLRKHLKDDIPIIGVGGIMDVQDALEKLEAGATLLQVYTGFIYEGPALIKNINKALVNRNFD
jgi:dihydroorotate dehydrogenase